jgi:hypothetical protein
MDINELRRLVRQRHAAATSKVSRLRRNKGVEIGGTSNDPRRDPSNIGKMRSRELQTYLRQLNTFTSRETTFFQGSQGSVLPGKLWNEYKAQERAYNRRGAERERQIANIKLPGQDMTVAQRSANMRPSILRASGEASTRPYSPVNRKPQHIADAEALTKLLNDMRRKNSRDYLPDTIKNQRKQAEHMMNTIGVGDQIETLRKLSDDQFDTLFNETGFAGDLGMRYGYMSMLSHGKKNAAHEAVMDTNEHDIEEQITWASNLPPRNWTRARKRK